MFMRQITLGMEYLHDNHVVHERLPNGWTKKAVKNLAGEQKGRWVVFLITPDQRMIRTEKQLKLYMMLLKTLKLCRQIDTC